jgi:hypothetical protein
MLTREKIITNMCYTWRHDYGMPKSGNDTATSGMSQVEREYLWNQMAQLFDNTIASAMEFKQ